MEEKQFSARVAEYKAMVEGYLSSCLSEAQRASYHKLTEAMQYSLMAGGKRLRPMLVLEFCRICGGDVEKALPVACGIEMLHTYSLIHDDLPVMDNDDLRRGKPSNHKVFGESTATLAGDALQALAFETVLSADIPAPCALKCAKLLANAAGHEGICGGQELDLAWEGRALSASELEEIYLRKTSALIRAACLMGVAAAGGTKEQEEAAIGYADNFGIAFQIRDDMLDVISTESELGKPIGSDAREGKNTFMALYGLERCGAYVHELSEQAAAAVDGAFADSAFLQQLARSLADRKN